jgi:pimeloyl-ACP methyl ester carboxylesterase
VTDAPRPDAFSVQRARVRDALTLAYLRAGVGGEPLLLVHGWPETMRIWWRNVAPLAAAGYEVIVPDLRGFGASDLAPDGAYDVAAHARDLHALVHDVLGHAHWVAAGGDLGGAVVQELGLRFPGFVVRQCVFNCPLPPLHDAYADAGLPRQLAPRVRMAADYFVRQGREADALAAELASPEARRRYVATFYGPRFWAAPGTFAPADVDFMTEPFAHAAKLRAGFGNYESALGTRPLSEVPCFVRRNPVPTLVLFGPEDHVIYPDFPARAAVVFTERVGPFVVPGAGHFLQWERADVFNPLVASLLAPRGRA